MNVFLLNWNIVWRKWGLNWWNEKEEKKKSNVLLRKNVLWLQHKNEIMYGRQQQGYLNAKNVRAPHLNIDPKCFVISTVSHWIDARVERSNFNFCSPRFRFRFKFQLKQSTNVACSVQFRCDFFWISLRWQEIPIVISVWMKHFSSLAFSFEPKPKLNAQEGDSFVLNS